MDTVYDAKNTLTRNYSRLCKLPIHWAICKTIWRNMAFLKRIHSYSPVIHRSCWNRPSMGFIRGLGCVCAKGMVSIGGFIWGAKTISGALLNTTGRRQKRASPVMVRPSIMLQNGTSGLRCKITCPVSIKFWYSIRTMWPVSFYCLSQVWKSQYIVWLRHLN